MLLDTSKKNDKGCTKRFFTLSDIRIVKNVKSSLSGLLSIRIKVYKKNEIENNDSQYIHEDISQVVQSEGCTGKNFCNKPLSIEVIKLTREFLNESKKNEKPNDIDSNNKMYNVNKGKKYILWQNFIKENSKGDILPTNNKIDIALDIKKRERDHYRDMAVEEGFLIKVNDRVFKLNKNI